LACRVYILAITMAAFGLRNQAIWTIARLSLTSIHAALSSALIPWRQGFFQLRSIFAAMAWYSGASA
jgi:hypothetical protein